MKRPVFHLSVSDLVMAQKEDADHALIWQTMHPVTVTLSQLKEAVVAGHPFVCSRPKRSWDGQRLFCIDIDHFEKARPLFTFDRFIAILDALWLPPCMAYTTFGNPDRKRERFRLLFQLIEPETDLLKAGKIIRHIFNVIDNLVPGAPDKNCRRPYNLFYPGKKIILYRPQKTVRRDIISAVIRELENPYIVIDTTRVWNRMSRILTKDPFIPSVTLKNPPARLLIFLGQQPWIINTQLDIKTSLGSERLGLFNTKGLCYNLIYQSKIIAIYSSSVRAAGQTKYSQDIESISVFEYYHNLLYGLITSCAQRINCTKEEAKNLTKTYKKTIDSAMGIRTIVNRKMILPSRYVQYANAVSDLSEYPNLSRLFQRDIRKQQVLASIILLAREIALSLQEPPHIEKQYVITQPMIAEKLVKKFKQPVSKDALTKWLRQFNDLSLIHICKEEEIAHEIKKRRRNRYRNPTVLQVPYYDRSVLAHAEILAARYKQPIKKYDNANYRTVKTILSVLLDTRGWFSRDAFIQCVQEEAALDNTDGFTVENARTYFDKHIRQIQQELGLTRSSCTKELITRFPGNHKIGLTKIYYRGE